MDKLKSICDKLFRGLAALQVQEGEYRGAILDPIDGEVVATHYAASHFGLGAVLRYARTGDVDALHQGLEALTFVGRSPVKPWASDSEYHWDFQNLAFMEAVEALEECGQREAARRLRSERALFRQSKGLATNWFAMRAVCRSILALERPIRHRDAILSFASLVPVALSFRADGSIDDLPWHSRPVQYCAYTGCLLDRHRLLPAPAKARLVGHAASYVRRYVLPSGQWNYRGRGHEQIFGYAAAIYLFLAANRYSGKPLYSYEVSRIIDHLERHLEPGGLLPLVLGDATVPERWGYYDYHHKSVYNAFVLAWLELSLKDCCPAQALDRQVPTDGEDGVWFGEGSGTLVVRGPAYCAVFARGERSYAADAGISPQALWFSRYGMAFCCPGGPTADRYGRRFRFGDVSSNSLSPLFRHEGMKHWEGPWQGKPIALARKGEVWRMAYRTQTLEFERSVAFHSERIAFQDSVTFRRAARGELRIFNWPVSLEARVSCSPGVLLLENGAGALRVEFDASDAEPVASGEVTENPLGERRAMFLAPRQQTWRRGEHVRLDWSVCVG